jgi:hypothetical protein
MTVPEIEHRKVVLNGLSVGVLSIALLLIRTRHSIDKFPADPGYDYIYSAATTGIRSWFNLDPYIHFAAHFLSWIVAFLPLNYEAVGLTLLNHVAWGLCSVGMFYALKADLVSSSSRLMGALSLVLVPVASESGLGNVGNVKWPLMALALVICSGNSIHRLKKTTVAVLILTGLTNPLLPVALVPLALQYRAIDQTERRKLVMPTVLILMTFLIQAIVVGASSLGSGRGDSRILKPWPGMGIFWWYGLVGPVILSAGFLILNRGLRLGPQSQMMTRIAYTVPTLAFLSYFYGGIADRYFIVPMVLSWITSTFLVIEVSRSTSWFRRTLVCGAFIVGFVVPAAKWFNSSWYLTSGPTWSSEVARTVDACRLGAVNEVFQIGAGNQTELPCRYILQGS